MGTWFIPYAEILEGNRADLSLGLRSAIRYYNDLAAPGVGGVHFVRRLSWCVGAIWMGRELNMNPTPIANGMEALGLKAYYLHTNDGEADYPYRGSRAFSRTGWDVSSYSQLVQARNYVQITYRQNTSRSLSDDIGLGLSTGGRFFNQFELTEAGEELAHSFLSQVGAGRGGRTLWKFLKLWIEKPNEQAPASAGAIWRVLGPKLSQINGTEAGIVRERLKSDVYEDFPGAKGDTQRRFRLTRAFDNLSDSFAMDDLKRQTEGLDDKAQIYLNDLEVIRAFFDLYHTGLVLLNDVVIDLETSESIKLNETVGSPVVQDDMHSFINTSKFYLDLAERYDSEHPVAVEFAKLYKHNPESILSEILLRDGRICQLVDNLVIKGPLYRSRILNESQNEDDDEDAREAEDTGLGEDIFPTIRNLFYLWKECGEYTKNA